MEDYDKIKKTLAVAFMHDLDANRPEGKMCLSNGECADIEKAFNDQDWSKLARYLDKYTESEDEIHRKWILEYLYDGLRKADEQFKDHFKSAIDWFKKQKEQKPISSGPNDMKLKFKYYNFPGVIILPTLLISTHDLCLGWLKWGLVLSW